jgi:D-glycero-D-manno-heptose 1,7-bisphosphate phosphatase
LHKNTSGNISFLKKKPQFNEKKNRSNFINTGIYFLKRNIIDFKVKQYCSLEKDILEKKLFIKNFNFKKINIKFYDIGDKNRIKKSYKIKNLLGSKNSQNAIFLDRDGTLIKDNVKYLHKIRDVKFISKTLKFIQKNNSFKKIFIVTNQSGLGRKFYSLKDFYNVSDFIVKKLRSKKIYINGIHFCPHLPSSNCECRKPKNKMLFDIRNSFNIDLKKSIMLGNEEKDKLFANLTLRKFYRA